MQEKDMVNDILSDIKSNLYCYEKAITECNNQTLRQTLQQMRDGDERFQYNLYKIALSKGYYNTPEECSIQEIQNIRTELNSMTM